MDYTKVVDDAEIALKAGGLGKLSKVIDEIVISKVPRRLLVKFSNICWRSGKSERGIRFLKDILMNTVDAEPDEIIEYCFCLQDIGIRSEALDRSKGIDANFYPRVLLLQVQSLVSEWNYQDSVPLLMKYTQSQLITDYQRTVGMLNLVAAHIFCEKIDLAEGILEKLKRTIDPESWNRLDANINELQTQIAIKQEKWDQAKRMLAHAESQMKSKRIVDTQLIKKWQAIIDARLACSPEPIDEYMKSAIENAQWETIRSLEFQRLAIDFDEARLNRLYWGTPYDGFRNYIKSRYSEIKQEYFFSKKQSNVLDLNSGAIDKEFVFSSSSKTCSLLRIVSSDFFRPVKAGRIYELLFEGEYFDVNASMSRVYQQIYRSRKELKDKQIPLGITENEFCYALNVDLGFCIRMSHQEFHGNYKMELQFLKNRFEGKDFSASDAAGALVKGLSTANRILRHGTELNYLQVSSVGRQTSYKFIG